MTTTHTGLRGGEENHDHANEPGDRQQIEIKVEYNRVEGGKDCYDKVRFRLLF
jgi:hypothetical protein